MWVCVIIFTQKVNSLMTDETMTRALSFEEEEHDGFLMLQVISQFLFSCKKKKKKIIIKSCCSREDFQFPGKALCFFYVNLREKELPIE